MDRARATEILHTAQAVKRRTREQRRAFWAPLAIFGAIVLLASPLYRLAGVPQGPGPAFVDVSAPFGGFAGGFLLRNPTAVSLFWLVALPLGYGATVVYYWARARRRGAASSVWPYAVAGLALLGVLVLGSVLSHLQPGDLFSRGLAPLLTVAVGLFVLAWAERSAGLAVFTAAFAGLALLVNLYDIENIFLRLGVGVPVPAINLIVPGSVLLLAAGGFWVAERPRP
jgi:hypothetical protein